MTNKKNIDINKKTSSLIINNSNSNDDTNINIEKNEVVNKGVKKSKTKKSSTKDLDSKEFEEESKLEFKEQVNAIRNIKTFLNMEVSLFLKKCINVIEKINNKIFGSLKRKKQEIVENKEEIKEEVKEEVVFSFKTFLEMNIIFTDNKRKPLYSLPKQKNSMYEHNDEILNNSTMSKIKEVFLDTANKLKKIPVPDKGKYKDIPLDVVMRNITDDEIYDFLFYVKKFPSKYIGKNYRISESFAAWVMSGTPDE